MRKYEVNIILSPNLDQSQLTLEKEIIAKALEGFGAKVEKVEEWGLRRLAYPIAKDTQGYFLFYLVEMPENRANDLARELRLRDNVRRVMVVKVQEPFLAKA
ncbi:MAG: 30S ribosomal protein S6 [Thermus sp.]|uniref:30S ribosomal protein S6 n=1 Tax=unclassified Thermus TaxID=2619321 RepID=UPI000238924C|nr:MULTISPECIES: 30S ribosomal protein S6 [unclassified Thermus]AEV17094.1 30S ribosomal protein S6 [Thermus sp. CCB_US3_UF1]MCS6869047.1 30S ribosomal protein S6 [Thermus sp.]MCS7217771.1 30S ribosomal protein S6 [Thermus sp.]MCX7849560.1 30S ribosomal protein S6 [Thermus sp.]MDW8016589.1 30S ribosomal protein S6 [Thermus sp.]